MAMTRAAGHQMFPSLVYGAGFVAVYAGQRIVDAGRASTVATAAGALLVALAVALRGVQLARPGAQGRGALRSLLVLYALGLAALLLYFLGSNVFFRLTGTTFEQRFPRGSGVAAALWPALLVASTLPVLFVELSLAAMKRAPTLDDGRVRAAMLSGLGTSFALVLCFAACYVAAERDVKLDLSYFRTAKAGDASKKLVRALDKPVHVHVFFPPANEVREEVESYFSDLTRESRRLVVEHYDHALAPAKAKELGVSGNGIIVIGRDAVREQIALPLKLESARSQLRVLDQEVHKRIMGVSRPDRIAYFTQGHDERTFDPAGDTDKRATLRKIKAMMTDLSFEPRDLGLAQGLAADVPADAAIVLIIGPKKAFLKEETASLLRYLDRKGRILVALDPDAGVAMDDLLAPLSLKFNPVTLANDRLFVRKGFGQADRANIATNAYSSHASVSTIGRFRAHVGFFGAGHLEKNEKGAVGIVNVDFSIHADSNTWADKNGNFEHDVATEPRMAYELAAAVSKRNASAIAVEDEARAVVIADSDAIADELLEGSRGNAYLAWDAVRWLGGEEALAGAVNTEEDTPVTHTRKQDLAWFYSSIFAAPALVLGIGFAMTRRRRPKKKPPVQVAQTPTPPPPSPEAPAEAAP